MDDVEDRATGKWCIGVGWNEVPHLTEQQKRELLAAFPPHERDARSEGIPMLGSGRIFPVDEELIRCEGFPIPSYWPRIVGIDLGWDHDFAAVALSWDRDTDTIYVTHCYKQKQATPIIHAAAIRSWGMTWCPVAWPHDAYQHDKGSGAQMCELYREQGLRMLEEHAQHAEGGYGVEAGIADMLDRMETNRWKVFDHLAEWFTEFRMYHRKDGKIVKERDDALSATRYALMSMRYAMCPPSGRRAARRPQLGTVA